ncbi:helix-turn-helix transcriptional regulator [Streptomyces milbemycinicus]|uniref:NlmRI n=1 Tax=Streptomyces nanchangensis TaxID=204925 RepID=Q0ILD5_9ACTN|nr:NlmRI [Streptomyces nanchangensis]
MKLSEPSYYPEIVERSEEISLLAQDLANTKRGEGAVVVIHSGPGVGRTALLDEFLRQSGNSGARVCAATGSAAETGNELGVVTQLFPEDGPIAAAVWLARALDDHHGDPSPDADRLFDMLRGEFRQGPLVLAVDDVQLADAASLRFLLHLIRRLRTTPVLIVLTEPVGSCALPLAFQAELLRHPRCRRLRLQPLSVDGVTRMIEPYVAETEVARLATQFHAVSGGNPVLVRGLLADHRAGQRLEEQGIGAQYNGYPAFTQAALVSAYRDDPVLFEVVCGIAVLGENASPALVACLVDRGADVVARVMTALNTASLLNGPAFRSPLVAKALLELLDVETRGELHRRAAELLHADAALPADVAHHLLATPIAESWVLPTLLAAAEQAVQGGGQDFRLDCLRLAGRQAATEEERAAVVAARVRIGWEIDPRLITPWLGELGAALRRGHVGSSDAAWTVKHFVWHDHVEEAADILSALMERTEENSDAHAELEIVRHWVRYTCPTLLEGSVDADAPSLSGPFPQRFQLRPASYAVEMLGRLFTEGPCDQAAAMAEEILRGCRFGETTVEAVEGALLVLVYAERPGRALHWCEALLEQAGDHPTGTAAAILSSIRAEIALRQGALEEAETYADRALNAISRLGWGVAIGSPLAVRVRAAMAAGRTGLAGAWLNQDVPQGMFRTRHGLLYMHARGHYHLATDRPTVALEDFLTCGRLAKEWGMDVPTFLPWRTSAALAHLALGNGSRASALAREQLTRPGGGWPRCRAVSLRVLAATSELDRRPALLRESVNLLESCGDHVELLHSLADQFQALSEAGAPAKARIAARHARTVADNCGTETLFRRLFKEEVPEDTDESADFGQDHQGFASLTDAERRVTALAALGYSNREIGRKLFITKSTVEQHLTRVYRKLGVRNRADLGDLLAGINLAAQPQVMGRTSSAAVG